MKKQIVNDENLVIYDIGVNFPILPNEALPPLPTIEPGELAVVSGRAPIWRYGMALHLLHGSPAGAVATYDPRLGGGVVVMTHNPRWVVGEVVPCQV